VQDGSYNILLEYADRGTLEDYLQSTDPPTTGEEIFKFWGALFNIIQALDLIHNVQGSDPNDPPILQGYVPPLLGFLMLRIADMAAKVASRYNPIQYSGQEWQKRIEVRL
jgi:hypothetical protein